MRKHYSEKYNNGLKGQRGFRRFLAIYFSLFIIILSSFSFYQYMTYIDCINSQLRENVDHIEHFVQQDLLYAQDMLMQFGKKIESIKKTTLNDVSQIIGSRTHEHRFQWLNFGWLDEHNITLYDQLNNINNDNKFDATSRHYVQLCRKQPGTVHITSVVNASAIGVPVIPGGYGVVNSVNGSYVGTVWFTIRIDELTERIRHHLLSKDIKYVILDEKRKLVLSSDKLFNGFHDFESTFFRDEIEKDVLLTNYSDQLTKPIQLNQISFKYYKKIEGAPYYIIVGFDRTTSLSILFKTFLPLILLLFSTFITGLIFYFIVKYRFFSYTLRFINIHASLQHQINIRYQKLYDSIHSELDAVITSVMNKSYLHGSQVIKIEEKFSYSFLNMHTVITLVHPNEIIHEIIDLFWFECMRLKIKIIFNDSKELIPVFTDKLICQIILANIIWLALNANLKSKKIIITARQSNILDKSFLIFNVHFTSYTGFTQEDILFDEHYQVLDSLSYLKLSFIELQALILKYDGSFYINPGESLIFRLPYQQTISSKSVSTEEIIKESQHGNIVPFPVNNK